MNTINLEFLKFMIVIVKTATIREINKMLEIEDIKWKQRAKRNWYCMGDWNTQFFHAWANQRRHSNAISSIKDLSGAVWSDQCGIGSAFTSYF
jgi:hypothetical protein